MTRRYNPLVPAAVAFLAGILLADYLGGGMFLWCAVALGEVIVWAALLAVRARAGALLVPVLVLVAAAGAARYRATVEPAPNDVARLCKGGPRVVTLEGLVVRSPRIVPPPRDVFLPYAPYYCRMSLALQSERAKVGEEWVAVRGRVWLTSRGVSGLNQPGCPRLGDRVQALGFLVPLRGPVNPGAFDFSRYMQRQGVRAFLSTDHQEAIRVVKPWADPVRGCLGALRQSAMERLEHIPTREGRAVVSAIMLGRRDLLDDYEPGAEGVVEEDFIASGAAHFLAVSGLHVGMVGGMVLLLLRAAGAGRRTTALLVALVVLVYALMTELHPSVLRAAVFVWILCLGWAVGRQRLFWNSLAAAAIIVLAWRPGDLFSFGFILSFGILSGLMFLCRRIEAAVLRRDAEAEALSEPSAGLTRFWRRLVRPTISISIAAAAISLPLVAWRFHLVGWLSPVTSVLLTLPVMALLGSGMVLVLVGSVSAPLAAWVAYVPAAFAWLIGRIVGAVAHVPGGHFYMADFDRAWILIVYGLLAAWVWRERLGISRQRLAMAALAAAAVFLWTTGRRAPDHVRATFLAVGSANTNLVELPNGLNLLYDVGSSLSYMRAGEGTTAPALWSRGIERVDAVFISHPHFDHFKDILPLVDRFGIRRVFVPPTFMRKRLTVDDAVVEGLWARGVRVEFFSAGDRLAGTGDTAVRAIWPRGPESQTHEINDGSLVLDIAERGRRLLLTGDIEAAGIDALLAAEPHIQADAMLWPHHGGDPDAVGRLAQATGAKTLVVSCGLVRAQEKNPPWVAEQGIWCRWTGRDGAVTVTLEANGPAVETFAGGR
ncbi:MAG TPA: ComEC/Rec2 family competence protein [Phycisphaerae bacterium]|nr:ComEC/Rec2 family competence protein [Phycisphaerae bacterium]